MAIIYIFKQNVSRKKGKSTANMSPNSISIHHTLLRRLVLYGRRKEFLIGKNEAEAQQLLNRARFIVEFIEGKLKVGYTFS